MDEVFQWLIPSVRIEWFSAAFFKTTESGVFKAAY